MISVPQVCRRRSSSGRRRIATINEPARNAVPVPAPVARRNRKTSRNRRLQRQDRRLGTGRDHARARQQHPAAPRLPRPGAVHHHQADSPARSPRRGSASDSDTPRPRSRCRQPRSATAARPPSPAISTASGPAQVAPADAAVSTGCEACGQGEDQCATGQQQRQPGQRVDQSGQVDPRGPRCRGRGLVEEGVILHRLAGEPQCRDRFVVLRAGRERLLEGQIRIVDERVRVRRAGTGPAASGTSTTRTSAQAAEAARPATAAGVRRPVARP